jgi:predicted GIY-YIG superfamily endonuclease
VVFNHGAQKHIRMVEAATAAAAESIVYCLATVEQPILTYIGATVDGNRRLRQHNGLLVGGAKATSKRPNDWYRVCYVRGFPSWRAALSFEWHWKRFSRKLNGSPLERRQKGLDKCLEWATQTGLGGNLEIVYE